MSNWKCWPNPFAPRPETLASYWATQAARRTQETARVRFQPLAARYAHDSKRRHGWVHEESTPDGRVEMTFLLGYLPYLAAWLLPQAGGVEVVSPPALRQCLGELARQAHAAFCDG